MRSWFLSLLEIVVVALVLAKVVFIPLQYALNKISRRDIPWLCRNLTDWEASGIARHPDRMEIYFRLQIQGNRKLIP